MRKNNDGYVIIYVVFVILFLCIVAVSTCTGALNNLKTQNAAVEQMQARYAAESDIERFMAEACGKLRALPVDETEYTAADEAMEAAEAAVENAISAANVVGTTYTVDSWDKDVGSVILTVSNAFDGGNVIAKIEINVGVVEINEIITETDGVDAEGNPVKIETYTYSYTLTNAATATSKYLSYTIENAGGGAA